MGLPNQLFIDRGNAEAKKLKIWKSPHVDIQTNGIIWLEFVCTLILTLFTLVMHVGDSWFPSMFLPYDIRDLPSIFYYDKCFSNLWMLRIAIWKRGKKYRSRLWIIVEIIHFLHWLGGLLCNYFQGRIKMISEWGSSWSNYRTYST